MKKENILLYLLENNNITVMNYIKSQMERSAKRYLQIINEGNQHKNTAVSFTTMQKNGMKKQKVKKENIGLNDLIDTLSKSIRIKNELIFKFQENPIFMIDLSIRSGIQCVELVLSNYQSTSIEALIQLNTILNNSNNIIKSFHRYTVQNS